MEQKFEFKGNLVRMKTDESEQYWFAGIDVCNILGLENPTQSVESLDEDEKKLDYILDSSGQQRKTWTINEFGLYSLVLKSRKPEAREFKRWITHEVLPAIRKVGRYTTDQERDREEAILKMTGKLRSLTVEKEELQRKLNEKRKIIEKTSIQLMQLLESDFRQFKLPFAD
uniref:BRO-N domain-containing protein n=1 Tax=Butyricimonas virosa TaxID=544645 RepID=UPI004029C0F0